MNTPKFWTKLFKWFCNDSFFEELQGDLEETYQDIHKKEGIKQARSYYRKEVLLLIRLSVIKHIPFQSLINWSFVRHAFKSSFRNLKKQQAYAALNIVGFAAAISICLFCLNAIYSNKQLDQKFDDKDLIYRVNTERILGSNKSIWATSQIALYEKIQEAIPEAEKIGLLQQGAWGFEAFVKGSRQSFTLKSVNEDFFDIFDFEVILGDRNSIFQNKSYILITEEIMDQYFDPSTVIGTKMGPYIIGAVIETPHEVSHLSFDILANDLKNKDSLPFYSSWTVFTSQQLYIKRYPESDPEFIQAKLHSIAEEINQKIEDQENSPSFDYRLENLMNVASSDASLNSGELLSSTGQKIVWALIIILLSVCTFNYTNLAMASAIARTKEVAVRKVVGSSKSALVLQFLAETLILAFTAFLFGIILFKWLAPKFASISQFYFETALGVFQIGSFLLFTFLMALVAGLIPGFILSNTSLLGLFRKTNAKSKLSIKHLKRSLVVIQMTVSVFVFILGYFLFQQTSLIVNQQNPLSKSNFVALQIPSSDSTNVIFRTELGRIKGIQSITNMARIPFIQDTPAFGIKKRHKPDELYVSEILEADTSILNMLGESVEWFAQRPKEMNRPFFLVNELFDKEVSDTVLNVREGLYSLGNEEYYPVLGRIKNFFGSDQAVDPNAAAILVDPQVWPLGFFLELVPGTMNSTLLEVQKLYHEQFPNQYFQPYFLDDMFAQSLSPFRNIIKSVMFILASIILITIMGQIGMSMYMAKTKEKEIGIRKVLGANFLQIVNLILRNTYVQLMIATSIAAPLAYLFYNNMVPSFTIPLEIGIWHFAIGISIFSLMLIALILGQTWGTTNAEPAEILRNE